MGCKRQTNPLTENVDQVIGGSESNTIDGSLKTTVAGRLQTWNNADQIDGGAGTDTLFAQLTANVSAASFKGVEVLDIEAQANNLVVDLNAAGDALLTTIKSQNSGANNLTVQNLQSAPTNFVLANDSGNFTVSVANTKLAGAADAATIDLSNVTAGTVTLQTATAANGYETITLNSNGSVANVLTSLTDGVATGLTTVNVAGAQALTLPLADTTVTTVNASTMTGILTLTVAAGNTQNMTITGGTANDVINMNNTYTNQDNINGGAGTDRLVLTNAEATGALVAQANVTNVEVIGLSNSLNGVVTVNNFGGTGVRFTASVDANADGDVADAGDTNNGIAGNSTLAYAAGTNSLDVQNSGAGVNTLAVNVAGVATNDVMNFTVGSLTSGLLNPTGGGGAGWGAGALTFNGAETVNLLSQGGANTFGGAVTLTNTAATESLVITGNQNLVITGITTADVINASGMTGAAALTLTGGAGANAATITGTANNDVLNGGAAGDIIAGGAGNDTINNQVAGTTRAAAGDVLTGGAGQDTFGMYGSLASADYNSSINSVAQISDFTYSATATATDVLTLSDTVNYYAAFGTAIGSILGAQATAGNTAIQTVAQNAAATAALAATDLIKLSTGVASTGLTVQQLFNAAIGTATVTELDLNAGAATGNVGAFVTAYDTTNSRMVVMLASTGADDTLATADLVQLVGTVSMSAADYANFGAAQYATAA